MPSQLPYIILTAVVIVLNARPLIWQFKQGNSGPIAMGVWTVLANIHDLVNTTMWYGDAVDRAPVWCDISVKLAVGQQIGRVAAVYCIARFLADIVRPRATAITRNDRRRRALYDYSVSFGLPAIAMACSVLYQPYRYRIVRGRGCTTPVTLCWPVLVLRLIWQPVFAVGGMLYSGYTVYRLILHRRDFHRVVSGAHSALTTTRFLRLTALSVSYLCIGIPLAFVSTYQYIRTAGPYADYSWAYTRSGWSVFGIPTYDELVVADFSTWSNVIVALFFFAAFGLGGESSAALRRVGRLLSGRKAEPISSASTKMCTGSKANGSSRIRELFSRLVKSESPKRSASSECPAHAYEIGKDVGFSRGIKVIVEEELEVIV